MRSPIAPTSRLPDRLSRWIALWTVLWMAVWVPASRELHARWQQLRREPDAGYSTETVVVTALLVVLAIIVIGIIAVAVTAKANSITL